MNGHIYVLNCCPSVSHVTVVSHRTICSYYMHVSTSNDFIYYDENSAIIALAYGAPAHGSS